MKFWGFSLLFVQVTNADYPTAPPPEQVHPSLLRDSEDCPTCPWNDAAHGPYPKPANAPESYQPIHRGQYFDVYGHWIETHYSEVYWTAQPAVPLPADLVERFDGRAISITGFEVDVVAGGEDNETEWSVPEFQVYNHHYCATIRGAGAKMTYVGGRGQDSLLKDEDGRNRRRAFEVHPPEWEPRDLPQAGPVNSHIPSAQNFWQGNGGEHRKSFKHLPRGTGQLIESPQEFILQPMLINTNFPAKPGQSPREAFHNAIMPNNSLSRPGANYSGLMECPCTTRTKKIITGFETRVKGQCAANSTVLEASECFEAAAQLVGTVSKNSTVSDANVPSGCFLVASTQGTEVQFNTKQTTARCGAKDGVAVRSTGSAELQTGQVSFKLDLDGATKNATITLTGPADLWFAVGFDASAMADTPYTIVVDGTGNVTERKLENHMPGTVLKPSVDIVSNSVGPAPQPSPVHMNHMGSPVKEDFGAKDWKTCQDACSESHRCGAWTFLPIRFTTPYNIEDGTCRLRSGASGFTSKGWVDGMLSGLKSGKGQIRTVVLRRPLTGAGSSYFDFDPKQATIPFIAAFGQAATFSYHGPANRGGGTIVLVEVGAPVCICKGATQGGSINGIPWSNNCHAYPDTTILRDHNPSCYIESYEGGMICCHHGIFLLDAEQAVPAPTFRFRMKYRFYYEDPADASPTAKNVATELYPGVDYQNAFFMFRETEIAHGEYDVPQCTAATSPEQCVHTVEGNFQLKDAMHECTGRSDVWCSPLITANATYPQSNKVALVHISPHCHGPACISMRMINADTNETICATSPHYGDSDASMNEAGYAAGIPPCVWGLPSEGLEFPPVLSLDTNLTVIKKVNSTVGHRGVMGHWQMRGIWAK